MAEFGVSFLYSGSLWSSLYCGFSLLCVGLYRWLVKVSWLGKLVLVFWWVELYFFSLLSKSWVAFLGAWCPLPAFSNCFVEFTRRLNALLMNLLGRKCSPHPTPPPSWLLPPAIILYLDICFVIRISTPALSCLVFSWCIFFYPFVFKLPVLLYLKYISYKMAYNWILLFKSSLTIFVRLVSRINTLQPHGLQHPRLPCPSPSPGACSNSCPLSQWCHPNISFSVIVPFSFCLQSFPESGSFPMSQLFISGGQSIGVSASASVLPMYFQGWFPLGLAGWISL